MNFGEAIKVLKEGKKVTRKGWYKKDENAKWLMYVKTASLPYRGIGRIDTPPWIGFGIAGGAFIPWVASHTDMLSEDWQVVE
jgi:hypothetical protein